MKVERERLAGVLVFILAVTLMGGMSVYSEENVQEDPNLIVYYKFDEGRGRETKDSSGNEADGLLRTFEEKAGTAAEGTEKILITATLRHKETDYYKDWMLEMTSGDNKGQKRKVIGYDKNTLFVSTPFQKPIVEGDGYKIYYPPDKDIPGWKKGPIWAKGIKGSCLEFNGKTDYVRCKKWTKKWESPITDAFTLEAWIYPYFVGVKQHLVSFSWHRPSLYLGGSKIGCAVTIADEEGKEAYAFGVTDKAADIAANEWQHAAVTFDNKTGDIKFYVNGVNTFTSPGGREKRVLRGKRLFFAGWLWIGTSWDGWNLFHGKIDEVKVYNRALSPEEFTKYRKSAKEVMAFQSEEKAEKLKTLLAKRAEVEDNPKNSKVSLKIKQFEETPYTWREHQLYGKGFRIELPYERLELFEKAGILLESPFVQDAVLSARGGIFARADSEQYKKLLKLKNPVMIGGVYDVISKEMYKRVEEDFGERFLGKNAFGEWVRQQTPAQFQSWAKKLNREIPKTAKEGYDFYRQKYQEAVKDYPPRAKINNQGCADFTQHFEYELGSSLSSPEFEGGGIVQIAFARGAARQYDKPWGGYIPSYNQSRMTSYQNSLSPWIVNIGHVKTSKYGPYMGTPDSDEKRLLYACYMSGANVIKHESDAHKDSIFVAHYDYKNIERIDFLVKQLRDLPWCICRVPPNFRLASQIN